MMSDAKPHTLMTEFHEWLETDVDGIPTGKLREDAPADVKKAFKKVIEENTKSTKKRGLLEDV